jgi:hypothetical protein
MSSPVSFARRAGRRGTELRPDFDWEEAIHEKVGL